MSGRLNSLSLLCRRVGRQGPEVSVSSLFVELSLALVYPEFLLPLLLLQLDLLAKLRSEPTELGLVNLLQFRLAVILLGKKLVHALLMLFFNLLSHLLQFDRSFLFVPFIRALRPTSGQRELL